MVKTKRASFVVIGFVLLTGLLTFGSGGAAAKTNVTVYKRIVSAYSGLTDIISSLGAHKALVGVTDGDKTDGEWPGVKSVGNHHRPDAEVIISLKPDLAILSSSVSGDVTDRLKSCGINYKLFDLNSIDNLLSAIQQIADLTGYSSRGQNIVSDFRKRLAQVEKKTNSIARDKKPAIFFESRFSPVLVTKGKKSIVNEIINKAGGRNIVKAEESSVNFSIEQLLSNPPDIYIIQIGPMNKSSDIDERSVLKSLPTFRNGFVFTVEDSLYSRPSPRIIEAIEELSGIIQRWIQAAGR